MKHMKLALSVVLALAATHAHATPPYGAVGNSINVDTSVGLTSSIRNSSFSGGNTVDGGDTNIDVRRPYPNGTAIGAASSNTTSNHRFLDSHSTSVMFFARSRTEMKFDIVSFVQSEPSDDAKAAACFMETEYRKFREYVLDPCM